MRSGVRMSVAEMPQAQRRLMSRHLDIAVLMMSARRVSLFERLSPALEQVDGSWGAIGTAVNNAIVELGYCHMWATFNAR
jgi:hypothetical protein